MTILLTNVARVDSMMTGKSRKANAVTLGAVGLISVTSQKRKIAAICTTTESIGRRLHL